MSPSEWLVGYVCGCLLLTTLGFPTPVHSIDSTQEDRVEGTDDEAQFTLSDEKRLIKRLLKNYENAGITGRPVKNTNEKVLVQMSLSLIQILDLDEKNQVLTISVWILYHWTDHILKWDPKNYSQVLEVRVPPKQVWTPDIVLYNYADERLKEIRDAMVIVQYDGSITWMPPAIFKSSCKIDIKNFPFDEQTCHMKFGSWTYDGNRLDITFINNQSQVLLDDYTESNEWEIIARPALRNVKYYPCCKEPYPDLTFFLFLRRNAAFFSYILVLPCVLLSSLTLVIFWLPPESPAKMVLGMNIFVAFFLLLLLLADSTPQASTSVPYIGYYYCLNMILITLSSFLSVIVINLYFRGDRRNRVPHCIRIICQALTGNCMSDSVASGTKPEGCRDNPTTNTLNTVNGPATITSARSKLDLGSTQERKPENLLNSKALDTSLTKDIAIRKTRKGKTRFASPNIDMTEATVLLSTVPEARALLDEQDEDSEHETVYSQSSHPQSDLYKKSKLRSRSLTPAKHELDEQAMTAQNNICQSHQNTCTMLLSDARHAQTDCDLCHRDAVLCANYCPCNSPPTNQTYFTSRHQRHPQSCQACLEHLNALRAYRTLDKDTNGQQCDNRLDADYSLTVRPARILQNHIQTVSQQASCCAICDQHQPYCHADNNQHLQVNPLFSVSKETYHRLDGPPFRYGYRKGRLALLANEQNEASENSQSMDPCFLCDQASKPRSENGHSRGRSKENKELVEITKIVEEEIRSIHKSIRTFLDRIAKKDAENVIVREWRMVAMVMDRIFFVCYLLIHLCAAFGLLVPNSHEADVVGFLRDYRLKNYNASYVDGEAMGLGDSKFQNSPSGSETPRMEKPSSVVDRQMTSIEEPSLGDRVSVDSSLSPEQRYSNKPVETDPLGLLALSPLSPYQRLVDEHSQGPAGTGPRTSPTVPPPTYEEPHATNTKSTVVLV
ncbi:Neuronal acetylcholine receptor subunit alpha-7 [Fasciola hepatica]|uniref:Neuronal acetylcholine receptor subunit alpha-7 n=1 Tax=Fasciola hepatica TaxID=6192 RepID=A0A4E0RS25_FASHE|nr:Neuronal acetylcholine receptor subunit alpha-7 [Fasciola hepatica]